MPKEIPTVMYGPNGEAETFSHPKHAPTHYRDTPAKARAHALGVEIADWMSNEEIVAACEGAPVSAEAAVEEPTDDTPEEALEPTEEVSEESDDEAPEATEPQGE